MESILHKIKYLQKIPKHKHLIDAIAVKLQADPTDHNNINDLINTLNAIYPEVRWSWRPRGGDNDLAIRESEVLNIIILVKDFTYDHLMMLVDLYIKRDKNIYKEHIKREQIAIKFNKLVLNKAHRMENDDKDQ